MARCAGTSAARMAMASMAAETPANVSGSVAVTPKAERQVTSSGKKTDQTGEQAGAAQQQTLSKHRAEETSALSAQRHTQA